MACSQMGSTESQLSCVVAVRLGASDFSLSTPVTWGWSQHQLHRDVGGMGWVKVWEDLERGLARRGRSGRVSPS